MEKKDIIEELRHRFPDDIMDISSSFGDDVIIFSPSSLIAVFSFLKNAPYDFAMLLDLTCIDFNGEQNRFEMVYLLFSLNHNLKIRFKTRLSGNTPSIDSLTGLWKNADWLEREVFDMFGIRFNGHPYLKRIFMYDGFEGYPLRKDYPLRKRQPLIKLRTD